MSKGYQRLFKNIFDRESPRSVDFQGFTYTDIRDYYNGVIQQMPIDENGEIYGAQHHVRALMYLSMSGVWEICSDDATYIDDWNVSSDELTHRHKELGMHLSSYDNKHYSVEFDIVDGGCALCRAPVPGEYDMIHKFYRMDG